MVTYLESAGDAVSDPGASRDDVPYVVPQYYPNLPNRLATELTPTYGRFGGYPRLHGRGTRGTGRFNQGYRGFSYRGGAF